MKIRICQGASLILLVAWCWDSRAVAQESIKGFSLGNIDAYIVQVQSEGLKLFGLKKVRRFKKDEKPKIAQKNVTKDLHFLSLGKQEFNKAIVTRFVSQSRKARYLDVRITNGTYQSIQMALDPDLQFLSLKGERVSNEQIAEEASEEAIGVLVFRDKQRVLKSAASVFRHDTYQVRSSNLINHVSKGMADQQSLDQSLARISGHTITIRHNGKDLVYPKKTPSLRKGEIPRTEEEIVELSIPAIVSVQEVINRRTYVFQRELHREFRQPAFRVVNANAKIEEVPVDNKTVFCTTDGLEISQGEVIKKIGMKKALVLVIPTNAKIQKLWSLVLKDETLIARSNQLLEAAYNNAMVESR